MFDGLGVWARRFGLLSLLGVAGCATAPSLPPMTPEMSARSEEALRLKAAETWVGKTFLCLPPNPSAAPKAATDWFKAKTGLTEAQIRERFILEPDSTPQANGLTLVRVKGKTSMAPEKARIVNQNLLVAVSTNDLANAKLWLDRGADANASQSDLSALLLALDRGNADMVRLLHSKGADLNDMNSNGISPLLFASSKRGSPMARVLVELGANVNIPDPNGITPLMMIASISGDLSLVELMVGKGADVNAKDKKGATAVDYAIQQKNQSLVEFLTSHGAKYPGAVAQ